MKGKLLIGIGIPGSGKTTFLKKFARDKNYKFVSPDELRKKLTGNTEDQSENKKVWLMTKSTVDRFLNAGKSVVLDATMTDPSVRNIYIEIARKNNAEVVGLYFDVPLAVALERNKKRERVVPEEVVLSMYKSLQENIPNIEEGFGQLSIVNEFGEIIAEQKPFKPSK